MQAQGIDGSEDGIWHGVVRPRGRSRGGPGHLFVHGAVATGLMWREDLDRFSGQFQCLAPDLPGLGRSKGVAFVSRAVTADLIAELVVTGVPARWAHVDSLSSGGAGAHTLLDRHLEMVDRALTDMEVGLVKGRGGLTPGPTSARAF